MCVQGDGDNVLMVNIKIQISNERQIYTILR